MNKFIPALFVTAALAGSPVLADKLTVAVTNLTNATYFTPLLVAAHSADARMFEVGTTASASLQLVGCGEERTASIETHDITPRR